MNITIEVGDTVHARRTTEQGTVVAEFVVTGVTAGSLSGSPLGDLSESDGWTFELGRKGDAGLPTDIAILAAVTIHDRSQVVKIIGPDEGIWRDASGNRVYPENVLAWMPWADYTPALGDSDPDVTTVE